MPFAHNPLMPVLEISNFAQIQNAKVSFGDLTVLVGPQATGKSLLLQWLKFALDSGEILGALREAGHDVSSEDNVLDLVFGEGMRRAWSGDAVVRFDSRSVTPYPKRVSNRSGSVFYIPAHRALLLSEGWPAPFMKLNADTPVVARLFSQNLYQRFSGRQASALFPVDRILKEDYRDLIDDAVFHGGRVDLDKEGLRYRLRLSFGETLLPFMAWTAGQREFTPLLLGLYHVLPPRKVKKRKEINWVIIEEPEMGLHPQGVAVVMLLVLDLLWRGYRVVISTHSPLILEAMWAIRELHRNGARWQLLSDAFRIAHAGAVKSVMSHALTAEYKAYFFEYQSTSRKVVSREISKLDPSSSDMGEADWGGLTGFSSRFGEAVRRAVNEAETREWQKSLSF